MDGVSVEDFRRLVKSFEELSARLTALTAVVGAMATASSIEYERLEECIHFTAKQLRAGQRPRLFENASAILGDFEAMQTALERTKILTFRKPTRQS